MILLRFIVESHGWHNEVVRLTAFLLTVSASAFAQGSPDVVISQVYGGGGNAGAPLRNDYIELFNRSRSAVDLTGWTVGYSSAGGSAEQTTPLSGMIQPGGYYLVWQAAGNNVTLPEPPQADASGTLAMGAAAGRVILRRPDGVADLVGYGTATLFEGSGPATQLSNDTAAVRRRGGCTDTDDNAADFQRAAPQPRNSRSPVTNCDAPGPSPLSLRISDIQGASEISPYAGQLVSVTGVVTGVRRDGIWIQSQSPDEDGNDATSEGLWVYFGISPPGSITRQYVVRVTGTVAEFRPASDPGSPPLTELIDPAYQIISSGQTLPPTVSIRPGEDLERYEGMRVAVPTMTAVGPTLGSLQEATNNVTSTGVFYAVQSGEPRPYRSPEALDEPEKLRVDSRAQGGPPVEVTSGATVSNIVGPLDYAFRTYTIAQDSDATIGITGVRSAAPAPAPALKEVTFASMNLQRLFDTADAPGSADVVLTPEAYAARLNKTATAIRDVLRLPDVIAVQEVENIDALRALADTTRSYDAHLIEGNDIGGIDAGLLTKRGRVQVIEVFQEGRLFSTGTSLLWDRPPLLARLRVDDFEFTVMVVHPRSLIDAEDADVADKRRLQAEFIRQVAANRMASGEQVIVMGDFNMYQFDPLMSIIRSAGLTNLTDTLSPSDNYSYVFDGVTQTLDHILISEGLRSRVVRTMFARLNADFPETLRANAARPERISDHDVPLMYLSLQPESLEVIPAGITNAATFLSGAVAPLEIVTVFGRGFTPESRLLFDGQFATHIYADAIQISAAVPSSVRDVTSVQVETDGRRTPAVQMPVAPTAPGIFVISRDGGRNQGAILNQDSTVNGPANPADRGSVIQIFATGGGLNPAGETSVRIGGRPAEILYSGQAPGLVDGALQVNARIPADVPAGDASVVLSVGGRPSAFDVVVAVR